MDGTTATSRRSPGAADAAPHAGGGRGLERLLERPQLVALACLSGVGALAWYDLLRHGAAMCAMPARPWLLADLGMAFVMWAVMMVAMMLPSAAPLTLTMLRLERRRHAAGQAAVPVALFVAGYLLVWTAWSFFAAVAQWTLQSTLLLSMHLSLERASLAGAVLVIAGAYQWTPLKARCLVHCQSPFGFLMTHWHEGPAGALRMGWHHGVFCVGCCWALMGILFVVGVMDLVWVAALTAYVLLEKTVLGAAAARTVGVALVAWGAWLVIAAFA